MVLLTVAFDLGNVRLGFRLAFPPNAFEACGIPLIGTAVVTVLPIGTNPKIRPAAIKAVAVDVINIFSLLGFQNHAVKKDDTTILDA